MLRALRWLASAVLFSLALAMPAAIPTADAQPGGPMLEPVDGRVIDYFRPPQHLGAPGNRGWEYATAPGSPVRAAGAGIVVFAGPIGGQLYVSVDHGAGLRTTYSHLATVEVAAGQPVAAGHQLGTTGPTFHFGARREGVYIDPATLFAGAPTAGPLMVRLVPRTDIRILLERPPNR